MTAALEAYRRSLTPAVLALYARMARLPRAVGRGRISYAVSARILTRLDRRLSKAKAGRSTDRELIASQLASPMRAKAGRGVAA